MASGVSYNLTSFPNPQTDPAGCGQTYSSYICDPDNIITDVYLQEIQEYLESLSSENCEDKCDCFRPALAIVRNMYLPTDNPSEEKLAAEAAEWARYLREDSWQFGTCDNDAVIFIYTTDNHGYSKVHSSVGMEFRGELTEGCLLDMHHNEDMSGYRDLFSGDEAGAAIVTLLEDYRSVFRGEHGCNEGRTNWGAIVGGSVAGVIVLCSFGNRKKKQNS